MKRLRNLAAAAGLVAAAVFLPAPDALGVLDSAPPTGAVGGVSSPATGTLELRLYATDTGLGLAGAEASLDGTSTFVRLGTGSCPEHPSSGSEPYLGDECPETVSAIPLPLDTRSEVDGSHQLRVRVTDAAANTATLVDRTIAVRNAPIVTGSIATVKIGVASESRGGHGGGKGGGKGKGHGKGRPPSPPHGACRKPKLKMRLARKPLWRTLPHHVPVLRFGRRYPYRGRLTCRRSGHRVSAPKGTAVGVYYRVWQRSFKRPWGPVRKLQRARLRVRKGGRLRIKLGFPSGRTLIFRYRAPDGELAKAKLRLAIPPRTRRPPWGPR